MDEYKPNLYDRIFRKINMIFVWITIIALIVMAVLTTADVLMRFIFNSPIKGTYDITSACWLTLSLAFGLSAIDGEHVNVDILVVKMKKPARRILNLITNIISFIFLAIFGWRGIANAVNGFEKHMKFFTTKWPEWPFRACIGVGMLLVVFALITIIRKEWIEDKPIKNINLTEGSEEHASEL